MRVRFAKTHLRFLNPYENLTPEPIELPERTEDTGHVRPPVEEQTFGPGVGP